MIHIVVQLSKCDWCRHRGVLSRIGEGWDLVQAIIGVDFASVAILRHMTSNNSYEIAIILAILQHDKKWTLIYHNFAIGMDSWENCKLLGII